MTAKWLEAMFARKAAPPPLGGRRQRVKLTFEPSLVYAIGDIHGRLDLFQSLEAAILADGQDVSGEKVIVLLGDLIDRGPHSAQVIDHALKALPRGWHRLVIAGNHEAAFCGALNNPHRFETWLGFGGLDTLGSYGVGQRELKNALGNRRRLDALLQASIPSEHLEFFKNLPVLIETERYVFAHAGGRPNLADSEQSDEDLLWYKGIRSNSREDGRVLVHGHEIVEYPDIQPCRINVDTGAYSTGTLTAVRLEANAPHRILQARVDTQ